MDIKKLIPQREPFLFLDEILDLTKEKIIVTKTFKDDEYFFQGHFPGNPIVPGVILCEHCFQSGAALISAASDEGLTQLAVVSRIQSAKFKSIVRPNDKITTETTMTEQIDNAAFFKSIVKNEANKKVLILEFACTLVDENNA